MCFGTSEDLPAKIGFSAYMGGCYSLSTVITTAVAVVATMIIIGACASWSPHFMVTMATGFKAAVVHGWVAIPIAILVVFVCCGAMSCSGSISLPVVPFLAH